MALRRNAILSSLARRLFEAVEEAAEGFDAVVTQAGPTVTLEPPEPGDAAPVGFTVDAPQQVSCFPGEHGMRFVLWRAHFDHIVAAAAQIASAALDGAYTEQVQAGGGALQPKIVASWPDIFGARHTSGLNTFLGVLNDENSVQHRYLPYRRAS